MARRRPRRSIIARYQGCGSMFSPPGRPVVYIQGETIDGTKATRERVVHLRMTVEEARALRVALDRQIANVEAEQARLDALPQPHQPDHDVI